MKSRDMRLLATLLAGTAASSVTSCSTTDGFGYTQHHPLSPLTFTSRLVDHERDDWNPLGIWRRAEGPNAVYLPADLPKGTPPDERHGTWTVDAVDGSRFFVPKGGTARYSEGILRGEARKATNGITRGQNATLNIIGLGLLWPVAVSLSAAGSAASSMPAAAIPTAAKAR